MWLTFIFIWLVQGGICYHLAKNKRKNAGLAFLVGCLLGIFAILYYALCGRGGVKCPYCKELIDKDAKVCPHCHKDLVEEKIVMA